MVEKFYYSMGEVTEMFDLEPSVIRYWCKQFTCLNPKRNAKGNRMFTAQDIERLKRIYHLLKEKKMTIEGAQKAMRKRNAVAEGEDTDVALLERLQSVRSLLVDMRNSIGDEDAIVEEPIVDEPTVEAQAVEFVAAAEPIVETIVEAEVEDVAEPIVETETEAETEAEVEPETETEVEPEVEEPAEVETEVEDVVEMAELPNEEVSIDEIFVEETADAVEPAEEYEVIEAEPIVEERPVEEVLFDEQSVMTFGEAFMETPSEETAAEPAQKAKRTRRKLKGEEGVVERPLFPFYEQTLF